MDYRTPLAKVRGLGTAHNGVGHWWMQRLSAIVLIPLSFWFVAYAKQLGNASYAEMSGWLAEPLHSICAIVWILAVFYHAALGLQVVIEDYIHSQWQKISCIWGVKVVFLGFALTATLAVLRVVLLR
jgi:succinate dehydrogenase / fumarate reductase membrane anchor subunit